MSRETRDRYVRTASVFLALILALWTAAFADESPRRSEKVMRPSLQKKTAPLLYELPASSGTDRSRLQIQVLRNQQILLKETIELPAHLSGSAAVEVLADHPKELQRLRRLEAARPGSLRIGVWLDQRPMEELSWEELEERAATLSFSSRSPVGSTLQVDVQIEAVPGLATAESFVPDPECEQQCSDEMLFCYEYICDPRAPCDFCERDYRSCVNNCPQVCVDPKRVYTYKTLSYVGSYPGGTSCFEHGTFDDVYRLWQDVFLERTYERTEYCNGTYSDRLVGQQYKSSYCWQLYAPAGCQGASQYVPAVCR